MITRKIGSLLRGKATPFQLWAACVLGSLLGFVPSLATSPGLVLAVLLLLVILNANLFIAGFVLGLAKALSLLALPLSFAVGRLLLDGPAAPLFAAAVNTPVLALFGLEYYATTGGAVLGLAFGVVAGLLVTVALTRFRTLMSGLEEGSPLYKKISSAWWARVAAFIFVGGGHGKKTYDQLLTKKIGNPVRPVGVVLALLAVVAIGLAQALLTEPLLTATLRSGLEQANGATVDLDSADADLASGRVSLVGLAMADPENLETDLLRAERVEMNLSARDLLTKRLAFDRVELVSAATGLQRDTPGRLVRPRPDPPAPAPESAPGTTIDDYITKAERWRDRLRQAQEWLERVSKGDPDAAPAEGEDPADARRRRDERIAQQIRLLGYARVKAEHLLRGAPTVRIDQLIAAGITAEQLADETIDVTGANLSTQPWLVEARPSLRVVSSGGTIDANIDLAGAPDAAGAGDDGNRLDLALRNLPGDDIGALLAVAGTPPVSGGEVDLSITGSLGPGGAPLDAPLEVNLRGSTLTVPGAGAQRVDRFRLAMRLVGSIAEPRVVLDDDALANALRDAGAAALAGAISEQAGEAIDDALGDALGGEADAVKETASDLIGNLLGGGGGDGERD